MIETVNVNSIPDSIANLIDRVCEMDPQSPKHQPGPIGVTAEIAQEVQSLTDAEIEALVNVHNLYDKVQTRDASQKRWAAEQLLSYVGPRVIPHVVRALKTEEPRRVQRGLISVLGKTGEPAIEVLDSILFTLTDVYVVRLTVDVLFEIGEPAAHLIALALEHSESATSAFIMRRINDPNLRDRVSIALVNAITDAIIDELIVRNPDRPDHFNDKITAECLQAAIDRNPQHRRKIQARLCDLAYQDDMEVRERAVQVGANLDLNDFLQLVRSRASQNPDVFAEIMYRLGRSEPLPTQQAIAKYSGKLEDLEKRSLERWDDMAGQSRSSFRLRNIITTVYFLVSLAVIGVGIWLFVTADNVTQQGIGAAVSALTAVGGILMGFWKFPIEDIKSSSIQQAGVEATFIGFMTRIGQIRLLFEQNYAKGEMSIEELGTYQRMIADTQTQTAEELALVKGIASKSQRSEARNLSTLR